MASIEEVPANRDLMTMPTYHPEDIIRLAMANPGYGFRRFLDKLYGGKGGKGHTLRLFEIHKHETGDNPFEVLQNPAFTEMITREEWKLITNNAPTPRGAGLSQARRSKLERRQGIGTNIRNIPLVPQNFEWLDVEAIPDEERPEMWGVVLNQFHFELMDYEKLLKLTKDINEYQPYNRRTKLDEISVEMGVSKKRIEDFLLKMEKYAEGGIVEEWIEVMKNLWKYQCLRGKTHKEDELMMEFRTIFGEYMEDPVNIEAPTVEEIEWVYRQLLEEENDDDEAFYPPEIDLELEKQKVMHEAAEMKFEKKIGNYREGTFNNKLFEQYSQFKHQQTLLNPDLKEPFKNLQNYYLWVESQYNELVKLDLNELDQLQDKIALAKERALIAGVDWDLGDLPQDRDSLMRVLFEYLTQLDQIQEVIKPYLKDLD